MVKVVAPKGLNASGKALWESTVAEFELSGHELALLGQACRIADRCEALENAVKRDGLMSTGSMGQPVLHPAVSELRQQQSALATLVKSVGLPEREAEGVEVSPLKSVETMQQRSAGVSRWAKAHG